MPDDAHLHNWLDMAQGARSGSRACRRASAGSGSATGTVSASPSTRWWPAGELKAPIVIGRDHLGFRFGREPQPRDRGDARRLRRGVRLAAAQCASQLRLRRHLVSFHHGGGASASAFSQHAGMVIVCGRHAGGARKRIERVLWNDPAIRRHAPRRCRLRYRR